MKEIGEEGGRGESRERNSHTRRGGQKQQPPTSPSERERERKLIIFWEIV